MMMDSMNVTEVTNIDKSMDGRTHDSLGRCAMDVGVKGTHTKK